VLLFCEDWNFAHTATTILYERWGTIYQRLLFIVIAVYSSGNWPLRQSFKPVHCNCSVILLTTQLAYCTTRNLHFIWSDSSIASCRCCSYHFEYSPNSPPYGSSFPFCMPNPQTHIHVAFVVGIQCFFTALHLNRKRSPDAPFRGANRLWCSNIILLYCV